MNKNKILVVLALFFITENLYSQNQIQDIEDEVDSLSSVKQGLEDSISHINNKIDSLEAVISKIRFESLSNNQPEVKLHPGSSIYSSPSFDSYRFSLSSDAKVYLVEIDGSNFIKISVDGAEGYTQSWAFVDREHIETLIEEERDGNPSFEKEPVVRVNYAQQRALAEKKRREDFIENNPNINQNFKNQILNGQISIGMTREMAEASWGKPADINRTVTATLVREQWVYGSGSNRRYLYFRNGILDSFQD